MAWHIKQASGHPIGAIISYPKHAETEFDYDVNHFFNYDKNNPEMGFDIKGYRPVEDILADYDTGTSDYHALTDAQFKKEIKTKTPWGTPAWLPMHHKAAKHFAKLVLGTKQG